MKKISARYFVILAALAVLLVPSCVREDDYLEEASVQNDDGKISIDGSLYLPFAQDQGDWIATKAAKMGEEKPTVKFLYLAVFSSGDILYEVVKAKPGTQSHPTAEDAGFNCGDENDEYLTKFHVDGLTKVSSGDRYVHFIATTQAIPEFENMQMNLVDEGTFVRSLVTSNAGLAYWGRRAFKSLTESSNMKGIKMVRNFSKVKVSLANSVTNFEILGFKVMNTPVYGTIAPFNTNAEDYDTGQNGEVIINFNRFANYETAAEKDNPYTWLTVSDNYHGFMPPIVEYNAWSAYYSPNGTDTMDANDIWIDPQEADYLYECSYRPDANPFIILKARLNEGGTWNTYYYKADFVYKDLTTDPQTGTTTGTGDNVYYNILRNFCYTLNITGVNGKGSESVYDAVNSIALNNFEGSTMAQELTNIANDDSRLYVSKTDILITFGTSFTMFVKSNTGASFTTNDNASITAEIRDATNGRNIVSENSAISIAESDYGGSGSYSDWREVTVRCADPESLNPGEVWKQPIVFKNASGLTRTVNLTLRRPFSLSVDAQDYVAPVKDTEVTVDFNVPAGLTPARFPLHFYLEQEENTLYPKPLAPDAAETLTVENGPSLIPGHTKNNYYYRRTINWDEYNAIPTSIDGIKTFRCYFNTMVEESATTVWVVASPNNDFYYPVDGFDYTNRDTFANTMETGVITFSRNGMQLGVNGTDTNLATANSKAPITYTSSNTAVATVDENGMVKGISVGTATITASAEAYKNYTAPDPVSYQVDVTNAALSGLYVDWVREPVYVVKVGSDVTSAGTYSVDDQYGGTPVVTYTSSNPSVATVSSSGVVHGVSAGTATITYAVTVPVNGDYAAATQSVSYDIQVVTSHPVSGTIYHSETFLTPDMGDYTIVEEKVTDGLTHTQGTDRTADFLQYTYFSAGRCYRHLWYPYYNVSTKESFGVAQSAWGAIEAPTTRWDVEESEYVTDYHNARFAAYSKISSADIDLSCSAGATITFYHAGNYFYNRDNMIADAHMLFSKDGGQTWSDPVDINYPPGSNWIYIKAQAVIPSEYLVSNFRVAFECSSIADTFSRLYATDENCTETGTSVTEYPVFYALDNSVSPARVTTSYTTTDTGYPVMVTNDDGRAGTWEIKNLLITEN